MSMPSSLRKDVWQTKLGPVLMSWIMQQTLQLLTAHANTGESMVHSAKIVSIINGILLKIKMPERCPTLPVISLGLSFLLS